MFLLMLPSIILHPSKKKVLTQLMTKDNGSSDTFGVVGQSSFLNTRRTGARFPGEFTLEQQESQGGFLRVDSLASACSQGYVHVGACARVTT